MGFKPDLDDQLVSFSAVGLVIWPANVPKMTYYVSSGTLNPTHLLIYLLYFFAMSISRFRLM